MSTPAELFSVGVTGWLGVTDRTREFDQQRQRRTLGTDPPYGQLPGPGLLLFIYVSSDLFIQVNNSDDLFIAVR